MRLQLKTSYGLCRSEKSQPCSKKSNLVGSLKKRCCGKKVKAIMEMHDGVKSAVRLENGRLECKI